MSRKLLFILGICLILMYNTLNFVHEAFQRRIPELKKYDTSLTKEIKHIEERLSLSDQFKQNSPKFLQKIEKIKYVSSKKEAYELYKKFKEVFEINVKIDPPKVKSGLLSFKVTFEDNPELLSQIYNFDPRIYFALDSLEFASTKNRVSLVGYIIYLTKVR